MKRIYYYFYIRIFSLWKKMPGSDVAFTAMAALSLILIINITCIIIFFQLFEGFSFEEVRIPSIFTMILVFVANYFIFIYKDRFNEIEKRFAKESNRQKKIGGILILAYIIFSFAFLIYVIIK